MSVTASLPVPGKTISGLVLEQGATFRKGLRLERPKGNPRSLAGLKSRMTVKTSDGTVIVSMTTENQRIVLEDSNRLGRVDLWISAADTANQATIPSFRGTATGHLHVYDPNDATMDDLVAICQFTYQAE